MNLQPGKTIFDKINLPYDNLRVRENPIKPIVSYYKSKLKPGEELWWMHTESDVEPSNIIIKIWSNLSIDVRKDLKNSSMAFFPELFGNGSDKFGRVAIWLTTRKAVVCPNVRDIFSAGGKKNLQIGGVIYQKIPRIFYNLFDNIAAVLEVIGNTSAIELSEYWKVSTKEHSKINDWIDLVSQYASTIHDARHIDVKYILKELIKK